MKIRAVIFDLGDTLLDFEPMDMRDVFRIGARESYSYLSRLGYGLPLFETYFSVHIWSMRWSYLKAKITGRDFNGTALIRRCLDRINLRVDDGALRELAWLWYEPVLPRASIEEGLLAALGRMRKGGLRLGIVSNTFVSASVLDRHLQQVGLLEHFPVRVYSSEFGYCKPNKRIFQKALDELGVEAPEAIFVGDLERVDILGARRIGMHAILKQPWGAIKPHRHADFTVRRACDVEDLVPKIESLDKPAEKRESSALDDLEVARGKSVE